MIKREDDGAWIELIDRINCHHDELFACLTTPEGLSRWFPVAARVDLRPGGTIVLGWDVEFTRKTTISILDYDPGGRIAWDWQVPHSDTHAPLYWEVEPGVKEGTRVILRQGPFKEEVESLLSMAQETETWRWHLCNLRCVLEVALDMRSVRPL